MALTETSENDRIEVVNKYYVQVRKANIIKKDDKEVSRTFHRSTLQPAIWQSAGKTKDTDISGESADVQAVCNAVWTDSVKTEFRAKLISELG